MNQSSNKRGFFVERLEERTLLTADAIQVFDLRPGPAPQSSFPDGFAVLGSDVFFTANNGVSGTELWKSDGTVSGTLMVKDIQPGPGNSLFPRTNPVSFIGYQHFENVNGVLYFFANDGTHGYELWKSDGTTSGTLLVKDINPGPLLANIGLSESVTVANLNGTLFFRANDGINGYELWKSDGTSAGTTLVKDIKSGPVGSNPQRLTTVNGTLFFCAGGELWKTDGTPSGTTMVKTLWNEPRNLTNVNGTLYFQANEGTNGRELWKSDGTVAGTVMVKDIYPGIAESYPREFINVGGALYFSATDDGIAYKLWKSDGTPNGTVALTTSHVQQLANVSGTVFFNGCENSTGGELWKSDGTLEGTTLVKDIRPGSAHSSPVTITNVNGTAYFRVQDSSATASLWKSDGTAAGTQEVQPTVWGEGNRPHDMTNVNGVLFFGGVNDIFYDAELWTATPGTPPTVSGIAIRGTSWNASIPKYQLPVGTGNQLLALPWTNTNQIVVTFSEDVLVDSDDLVVSGVTVPIYSIAAFSYDSPSRTATWTLSSAINADKLSIHLNAMGENGIRDQFGNLLDGEWANPTTLAQPTSDTFPSGNGAAGGDFSFRINVLPGDINGTHAVSALDLNLSRMSQSTVFGGPGYNIRNDVNASGGVSILDLNLVRLRNGNAISSLSEPPFDSFTAPLSSATSSVQAIDAVMRRPSSVSFLGGDEFRAMLETIVQLRSPGDSKESAMKRANSPKRHELPPKSTAIRLGRLAGR